MIKSDKKIHDKVRQIKAVEGTYIQQYQRWHDHYNAIIILFYMSHLIDTYNILFIW